ncbi:MAG: site-specific integrase [Nitrospinota bacterium]
MNAGELAVRDAGELVKADAEAALEFMENIRSVATRRAYASDWRIFTAWASERGITSLPASPEAVCTFLVSQPELGAKASTLGRRMAAIRLAHTSAGLEPPTASGVVKTTMKGIRRKIGTKPTQKAPATCERIMEMASHCPDTLLGYRDRAILLLGFAGAFRRSELAALMVADLEETENGLRVHVRRSKTDQEGAGEVVPIIRGDRACPVEAVKEWMNAAGISEGPVFRRMLKGGRVGAERLSPHSIGATVKCYAELAGYKAAEFGGHSFRAGFATSAAEKGANIFRIMDVTRHRSVETVRGYVRRAEEFKDHAGAGLL